jgi:hypothetical protein
MTSAHLDARVSIGRGAISPASGGGPLATAAGEGSHLPGLAAAHDAVGRVAMMDERVTTERRRAGFHRGGGTSCDCACPGIPSPCTTAANLETGRGGVTFDGAADFVGHAGSKPDPSGNRLNLLPGRLHLLTDRLANPLGLGDGAGVYVGAGVGAGQCE